MYASYTRGVAMKPNAGGKAAKKPAANKFVSGLDKGRLWMAEDFDMLTERELADWYEVGHLLQARNPSRKER
jgi:hypothetical protein